MAKLDPKTELEKKFDSLEKSHSEMVDAIRRLGNQQFECSKSINKLAEEIQNVRGELAKAELKFTKKPSAASVERY